MPTLKTPINITEEQHVHDSWYEEAREQTLETLPSFLQHLTTYYTHDYGTICHAVAAAGLAAMHSIDKSSQGGITGFQAGVIIWKVIEGWNSFSKGPKRMVIYEDMLYPQYYHKFSPTIPKKVWDWLQSRAREIIAEGRTLSPTVEAHLKSIVAGIPPFGHHVEPTTKENP